MTKVNLEVRDLPREEFYKGLARVWVTDRGAHIKLGSIVRVRANDGPWHLFAIFGTVEENKGSIALDHYSRDVMKVRLSQTYEFTIENAGWTDKLVWAARSPDPAARIAAWIGILSGIIGVLGLVLAVVGLYSVAKDMGAEWCFLAISAVVIAVSFYFIGFFLARLTMRAASADR